MGRFVGFYLSAVGNHLRNATNAALKPLGLDTRKLGILDHLQHASRPLSQREVSRALRMDRTTVMDLMDELVQAGFVAAGPSGDQRMHALSVTPAGRSTLKHAASIAGVQEIEHLQPLNAREREALLRALNRVANHLSRVEKC